MLEYYFHEEGEHLSGAVINHIEIALHRSIDFVIEKLVELHRVVTNLIIKGLEPFLNALIDFSLLEQVNSQLGRMQANINKLEAKLLQFVLLPRGRLTRCCMISVII
jgi:hypothetical protein